MRPSLMDREEVRQEARDTRQDHPSWARDARKRWALALGRVRKVLMEERKRSDRQDENMIKLQVQLNRARIQEEEGVEQKRQEVLQRMDKRLSTEQNERLREIPSEELIEEIVRSLPAEKVPGIDGVVIEILTIGWQYMKVECFEMIRKVWTAKKLLNRDNRGLIKLIPKNEDRFSNWLTNWRPITLLTVTYKINANIIASRLKDMMPGSVDRQQTGFIAGRDITENVLSLRLAQEWTQVSGQMAISVKLDFQNSMIVCYMYFCGTR
ncbi:hypothetical protein R1sor_015575 [Riccia sorocarpa]|uniref:Reverse transcriptase domain-containing protein n=1 Tax=Riccia sorocarpa TaxID=122646 RepID=A0ABD3HEF3_9MARC